jgi:hypothetical protein
VPSNVIPDGFAHVLHSLTLAGDPEPMAVTYGVGLESTSGSNQLPQLAQDLHGLFGSNMMPKLVNKYSLTRTMLRAGQADLAPDFTAEFNGVTVGTGVGNTLPQNCAILVKKATGLAGRRNRGRFYLPGIDESTVNEVGIITAATVTSIQNALNTFLTAVNGNLAVTNMVIIHQGPGDVPFLPPTPVTQLICDPLISTQRTRLRR